MTRAALLIVVALAAHEARAQCYELPFGNPNLSDGWGSTCCGRSNPHRGVDFAQAPGTSIPSVADGVVRLKTSTGCLGNVVVVEHADGVFSGYAHMAGQSPLAEGTAVAKGQTIGQVGNTGSCTTGPHLHLTIAPTLGGYTSGETFDPYAYITARESCDQTPVGYVDTATCEGIAGWAQDPDVADAPIEVHVYVGGPAGDPAAHGFSVRADQHRDDLCAAIGSCAHGFNAPLPLAFFDGVERPVFAYGIGADGGANAQLGNTPMTMRCDSEPALPTLPFGVVRRHVASFDSFTAWRFEPFDIAPLTDAVLEGVALGPDVSPSPELVRVDGTDAVYVREGAVLRHVTSPAVMTAWGFDFGAIVVVADLDGTLEGAPWPDTPFLAQGSSDDVWLLDAPPPLWGELVSDDIPARMTVGEAREVTLRFKNRGAIAWDDVVLAPTPRDEPSALCDESWTSCTRAAALDAVVPGDEGTARVTLHAPLDEGSVTACFGLVTGDHWFSDPGQSGPRDDELCRTIEIAAAASEDLDGDGVIDTPLGASVTSCSSGAHLGSVGLLLALAVRRRRTRR